jgi:hypothetical protein
VHRHVGNRSNCIASRSLGRDRRRRSGPEAGLEKPCRSLSLAIPVLNHEKSKKQVPGHSSHRPHGPPCPGRALSLTTGYSAGLATRPASGPAGRGLAASRTLGGSLFGRANYGILCSGSGQDSRLGVGAAHQRIRLHRCPDTGVLLTGEDARASSTVGPCHRPGHIRHPGRRVHRPSSTALQPHPSSAAGASVAPEATRTGPASCPAAKALLARGPAECGTRRHSPGRFAHAG